MTVSEVFEAVGNWDINLKPTIPRDVYEKTLGYFGHVAIVPGRVDPKQLGDNMLSVARYVGVLRRKSSGDDFTIGGGGMILWLGDEDDKGNVLENATTFVTASFANTIRGLLPPAVTEGNLYAIGGTYSGTHQWETPRSAIQYVCDTFGADYRVNNNGTIDAGPTANLFVTNPTAIIVRYGAGHDPALAGLPGSFETQQDVEDFTTRVVLLAEGDGTSIYTGSADINPTLNPYKDIHGNTVVRTRMVSESETSAGNATTRAQLQLNRFTGKRNALQLSTVEYDIKGEFNVGDYVWVYDPDSGLVNTSNEVYFRGSQFVNPIALRVKETNWPVTEHMTVAYRAADGTWTDITDYVEFETGAVSVVVGDFSKSLTDTGFAPVGDRPSADTSIPDLPTFITPFTSSVYIDGKGFTRSTLSIKWNQPNNVDGSTILDGDHYEIQYTIDSDHVYPQRWSNLSPVQWNNLGTWGQPFVYPDGGLWNVAYAPWPDTNIVINDLSTGVGYKVRIRAVDKSGNQGPWSVIVTSITTSDNIPPSQPTAPTIAASRIAFQVTHDLGTTLSGPYTLEYDLDHLNVHVGQGPDFYPDDATMVGKIRANSGMVQAQIPAVGTFNIEDTTQIFVKVIAVDIAGNKSVPSPAGTTTALLIDNAHISDVTVSKLTAGVINADFIVGARIKTADSGTRVEMNSSGIQAFNSSGTQTLNVSSADGSVNMVGTLTSSGSNGARLVVNPIIGADPEIRFYVDNTANYHYITSNLSNNSQLLFNSNDAIDTNPGFSGALDLAGDRVLLGIKDDSTSAVIAFFQVKTIPTTEVVIDGNGVITMKATLGTFTVEASQTIFNATHSFIDTANAVVGGDPDIYSGLQFLASGNVILEGFRANWTGSALQFARNDTNTVVKTFIIDHPADADRYLVHATTESPHNGVEYWGTASLDVFGEAAVTLPAYFEELTSPFNRAVFVTPVNRAAPVSATEISSGKFRIRGPQGIKVSWLVKAVRKDVPPLSVEPLKANVDIYGDGPYKYYLPRGM
jgi:hypothetical protein